MSGQINLQPARYDKEQDGHFIPFCSAQTSLASRYQRMNSILVSQNAYKHSVYRVKQHNNTTS